MSKTVVFDPGDQVEVTRTSRGGFFNDRYQATVIAQATRGRVKVTEQAGKVRFPFLVHVKKLR